MQWQHAVLTVEPNMVGGETTYRARAWNGSTEIYDRTLDASAWSVPLADLGADGWELVSSHAVNALYASHLPGMAGPLSFPASMTFFLKRSATTVEAAH
jgi:hypothetical protein